MRFRSLSFVAVSLFGLLASACVAAHRDARRIDAQGAPVAPVAVDAPVAPAAPTAKGWLCIVGGGGTQDEMYERMLHAAGGKDASVVVLPQASELADTGAESAKAWREHGATKVEWIDLKTDADAARKIAAADVIWFPGGVQTRLMKALDDAGVTDVVRARYRDGAVVGGTSAGAAVMSDVMLTGDYDMSFKPAPLARAEPGATSETAPPPDAGAGSAATGSTSSSGGAGSRPARRASSDDDDSGLRYVRVGTNVFARGLGLLPNAIVDQHFVRRQRFNRLLSAVLERPELVGIGIDEKTSILVHGSSFEVLGVSNVLVIDARRAKAAANSRATPGAIEDVELSVLRAGMTWDFAR